MRHRIYRFACGLMLCLISLLGMGWTVRAAHPMPSVRRFSLPTKVYGAPVAAGDIVAWVTRSGSCRVQAALSMCVQPPYLRLASVRSFHPHTIAHFTGTVSVVRLYLSQRYLVWVSDRYPLAGWWLWSRDLRTGRQTLIDSSQVDGDGAVETRINPSLRGNTLAWTKNDCFPECTKSGNSSITTLNLSTGRRWTASVKHGRCWILSTPTLSTRTLTWAKDKVFENRGCRADNREQVMRMDRGTSTIRTITIHLPHGAVAGEITGNDRYLVWIQGKMHGNGDGRVILMDMTSGRIIPVTGAGSDNAMINEDMLVWHGQGGRTVGVLNLHVWRYYVLDRFHHSTSISTSPGLFGQPWGKRLVWVSYRSPDAGGPSQFFLDIADLP